MDKGIPTKKGQLSEDSEAVVLGELQTIYLINWWMTDFLIDFQDNEVSTYFPVLGQKPISPNQDDNLNLEFIWLWS